MCEKFRFCGGEHVGCGIIPTGVLIARGYKGHEHEIPIRRHFTLANPGKKV